MGWLKGLVAPAAFGNSPQQQQQGYPMQQGGPPMGGMPQGGMPYGGDPSQAYGMAPGMQQQPPMGGPPGIGAPGGPAAYDNSQLPNAMQWSTGTKSQGGAGPIAGPIAGPPAQGGLAGAAPANAQSLEARCAQLQHDVDSLALFARTLLTMLEDGKVVTRQQFDETKNRLDMLDGKLDDK